MPVIDPVVRFWISIIVTFAIGVSQGTVVLTNAVPDIWIKPAIAWCGIIAFLGSSLQTAISGVAMTTSNRLASAAAVPAVQKIITTPEVANSSQFATNDKVVSK